MPFNPKPNQVLPTRLYSGKHRSQPTPVLRALPVGQQGIRAENTQNVVSTGLVRLALPFKKGDIKVGANFKIVKPDGSAIVYQINNRNYHPDGSLRICTVEFIDTDFAANEKRNYKWEHTVEAIPPEPAPQITVADITAFCDLKIDITNNKQNDGTADRADPAGTTFTASLNKHLTDSQKTSFRTDNKSFQRLRNGPVMELIKVWGWFESPTAVAHKHLKAVWYLYVWKNPNGTIRDIEYMPKIVLSEWAEEGKYTHFYDASLKNNGTELHKYVQAHHHYNSEVFFPDMDESVVSRYGGTRFLNSANTLHVYASNHYTVESGLVPPYAIDNAFENEMVSYESTYIPGDGMHHRGDINGTGGYMGRPPIPLSDIIALREPTAEHYRDSRVNALAVGSVPYHHSNNPNGPDTIIPNILKNPNDPFKFKNDYTADGMPASQYAYQDNRTPTEYAGGFVRQQGRSRATRAGAKVPWERAYDASHAVNYSGGNYVLTGDEHMLDGAVMMAANLLTQTIGNPWGGIGKLPYTYRTEIPMPDTVWEGIAQLRSPQPRAFGIAFTIMSAARAIVPQDAMEFNWVKDFVELNADYLKETIRYLPQHQKDAGVVYEAWSDSNGIGHSTFMQGLAHLGFLNLCHTIDHPVVEDVMQMSKNYINRVWEKPWKFSAYRGFLYNKAGSTSEGMEYVGLEDVCCDLQTVYYDTATKEFTVKAMNLGDTLRLQNGDKVRIWPYNNTTRTPDLSPFNPERFYYVVDVVDTQADGKNKRFKLADTAGGAAIENVSGGTAVSGTTQIYTKAFFNMQAHSDSYDPSKIADDGAIRMFHLAAHHLWTLDNTFNVKKANDVVGNKLAHAWPYWYADTSRGNA